MSIFRKILIFVVGLMSVLLTSCSTTHMKTVWKDPSYLGHPKKIMVIAVAKEPINRRIYEDEFVLQLKAHGTDAIASYTTLADKLQDDQVAIAKMVKELGADTVLISRLVSKRSVQVYYPATISHWPHYYGRWPDYYLHGHELIHSPGYSTNYEYVLMETNLYDSHTDKLLWATTTETGMDRANEDVIQSYIETILNIMAEHGLFKIVN